jgi:CheY-like chemotaxis protein
MPLILIVDDRQTNRAIFSKLMGVLDKNVEVQTMATPEGALKWLKEKTPDLVIVDYSMPEMNGAEFTRQIRDSERLAAVPVIIITAHTDNAFEANALEAGASDFVRSPVDQFDFMSRAKGLLKGELPQRASHRIRPNWRAQLPMPLTASMRILIAEPDDFSRKQMEHLLSISGHRCAVVSDSDEALDALEAGRYDLVLMSTSPDYVAALEATKLYRFLALDRDHVPIVALIDNDIPNFGKRCIEAGMDAFIVRPVTAEALRTITQRYCRQEAG